MLGMCYISAKDVRERVRTTRSSANHSREASALAPYKWSALNSDKQYFLITPIIRSSYDEISSSFSGDGRCLRDATRTLLPFRSWVFLVITHNVSLALKQCEMNRPQNIVTTFINMSKYEQCAYTLARRSLFQ